jgi:hypothetical protein
MLKYLNQFFSGLVSPQKNDRVKYSANVKNGYTADSFKQLRLPNTIVGALVDASNHSLALTTWSSYNTAENHIKRCEVETGVRMTFPMDDRMVVTYVGWLIVGRKVSSASINQYLSGLRVAHLKHGVMPKNLRSDMLSAIIKGKENEENSTQKKIPRLAMTMPVLKLLKGLLSASELDLSRKRLVWAVSCMAFHGSFRIHELLSREALTYDPKTTLLGCDIREG